MGLMEKLAAGAERAAKEAEKAFDKGKAKVGELQIEMQMDGLAKKLGYLVFDFYRGREVDQALRQKILDDLSRLEDNLEKARAEAAAKAQAEAEARARATTETQSQAGMGSYASTDAADFTPESVSKEAEQARSWEAPPRENLGDPLDDDDAARPATS